MPAWPAAPAHARFEGAKGQAMTRMSRDYKMAAACEDSAHDRRVLQVARKAAEKVGDDLFRAIARNLAKALSADCVVIGEFAGGAVERVRTLGADLDGQPASFEYELTGSAAARVAAREPCQFLTEVQTRFPSDPLLAQVGAQACVAAPLPDSAGEPVGFIMALYRQPMVDGRLSKDLLDIFSPRAAVELKRKQEEDRLRESEQRYRAFVARNADAMWRFEFERPIDTGLGEEEQIREIYRYGYLAECNESLARLLGAEKPQQLIGARIDDISPLSDPSIRRATLLGVRGGHSLTMIETTILGPDGKRRHMLRSQWGIVEEGKLERIWGTSRDVTDLKHSERALQASEQRMSDLLENIQLAVVMANRASEIVFCNTFFYGLSGWTAEEVSGKDWIELMAPPEERSTLRAMLAGSGFQSEAPFHFESTLLGPDGQRWQFEWDRTMLRNVDGRIEVWAHIGRDVTHHRAIEKQFRESQKLETIGRLAGGLAHSFNNLLAVIMGYSGSLLNERDASDPAYEGLTEIHKAAGKGGELSYRLLAFSKRQPVRRQATNLNTLIADLELMLQRLVGDDVMLTTTLDPALGFARVDQAHFQQVLMNLASNGRDAMPHGGVLTIATRNLEIHGRNPLFPDVSPGSYVTLSVSDTGMGMTADVQSHLFEAFYSTKEPSECTGLGLSSVQGIVWESGGSIVVESACGKGSIFTIFLPGIQWPATYPAVDQALAAVSKRNILLVDDEDEVRKVAARILTQLGYVVLEAASPQRALEIAQDRQHPIHLLLTDVVMPEMNGFELADLVKTYQSGVKVLIMSGYTDPEELARKLSEPGFAYLPKPFMPEELATSVREILER
jgi:two-component system cell cycle sensor histidine kinase/response regulator CckA